MAILPVPTIDAKAVSATSTALRTLTASLSPASQQASTPTTIATLRSTSALLIQTLESAHSLLVADRKRLEKHVFADPLIASTLFLAYDDKNDSNSNSNNASAFPARVYANIDACLALYDEVVSALREFEQDLRRDWNGASVLSGAERKAFVCLQRDRLVAVVGVSEGLRGEVVERARGLEEEIRGLEGRLRRGEELGGEGDGFLVERGG